MGDEQHPCVGAPILKPILLAQLQSTDGQPLLLRLKVVSERDSLFHFWTGIGGSGEAESRNWAGLGQA